jgi:L-threonylcarbamoyladenylate synthase
MITIEHWDNPKTITLIISLLKKNKICITTTDTVMGFLAPITKESFNLLSTIKGGREQKPFIILIESLHKLTYFTEPKILTPAQYTLLKTCWPGPLMVIVKAKDTLPPFLKSQTNTIALRCPLHTGLSQVLSHFDGLFSTSANKSNEPIMTSCAQISAITKQNISLCVENSLENSSKPSTIIDLTNPQTINLVREGAYPLHKLEDIYGNTIKRS